MGNSPSLISMMLGALTLFNLNRLYTDHQQSEMHVNLCNLVQSEPQPHDSAEEISKLLAISMQICKPRRSVSLRAETRTNDSSNEDITKGSATCASEIHPTAENSSSISTFASTRINTSGRGPEQFIPT